MAIHVGNNFCIAPFTQLTFGPNGNYSPCAEIGGRPWKESSANPVKMWSSQQFKELRDDFLSNNQSKICNRCWDQESFGSQSLRRRLLVSGKFGQKKLIPYLESEYQIGPQQLNIMVGNKCNLRCRICSAGSSVTYNAEGKVYEKKFGIKTQYTTKVKKTVDLTPEQIDEIIDLSTNLKRIEFYGGEPLLDSPTLTLLRKLIDNGRSQSIVLFYNTNGTVSPTEEHYALWNQFKSIEFNFSIDDIDQRYTYNRHPGIWEDFLNNITSIRNYDWAISAEFYTIVTISSINVYYLGEILDRLDQLNLKPFINPVFGPNYYKIENLPMQIKSAIHAKLSKYHNAKQFDFVLNMLTSLESAESAEHWQWFKNFTKAKDEYRDESFADTCPEYYKILNDYDSEF